ncbi:MAG: hypothetical protein HKN85_02900 [Gammaproteobacteria bacterium]|nr:hypothetical protein [Gammaproteobacteria bacterium]
MLNLLEACFKIGFPMTMLSWLLFSWLYSNGSLDKKANRKTISANLKMMKKTAKTEKREARRSKKKPLASEAAPTDFMQLDESAGSQETDKLIYVYDRWMWFGSGFYGLAALWTFVVIETLDVYRFIFSEAGLASLFEGGFVNLIVSFVINQIGNIVTAFIWFTYWTDDFIFLWVIVAYVGYLGGIELAKRRDLWT